MPSKRRHPIDQHDAPSPDARVAEAFAVRESSLHAYLLMEGMIAQTLSPSIGEVDGVDEVLDVGLAPLTSPTDCPFPVRRFKAHRTNASTFQHKESIYLYALGTAAAINTEDGDNAWTRLLCDLITTYRPRRLHVANFTRLLRSAEFSGQLMSAVKKGGTIVISAGLELDVRSQTGRTLWQAFTMVADLEHTMINQRLFAGMVNKFQRGEWILGAEAVPPGYRVQNSLIVLDEDQVPAVRALIELLADPTLSDRQVVDAAGRAGLTSPTVRRLHGDDATYIDVKRSGPKVNALRRHIDTWRTGQLEIRIQSPYYKVNRIRDVDIVDPDPPRHYGYAVFKYTLDLPDGGWASNDTLDMAAQRRTARAKHLGRGPQRRRQRRPLSGWASCKDDDGRATFISGTGANYVLLRQDAEPDPT